MRRITGYNLNLLNQLGKLKSVFNGSALGYFCCTLKFPYFINNYYYCYYYDDIVERPMLIFNSNKDRKGIYDLFLTMCNHNTLILHVNSDKITLLNIKIFTNNLNTSV